MLYMNNAVTRGRAEMLVTATGMYTEIGKLAGLLAEAEDGDTPLQIQLDSLGKRLALIARCDYRRIVYDRLVARRAVDPDSIHRDCFGRGSHSRRPARSSHCNPGFGDASHGPSTRYRQTPGRRRNLGLHDGYLHRQDRHLDRQPDDCTIHFL